MKQVGIWMESLFDYLKILLFYIFYRRMINMVDMYTALVIAGRRTCNPDNTEVTKVPERYRQPVLEELAALGLDADGNPVA